MRAGTFSVATSSTGVTAASGLSSAQCGMKEWGISGVTVLTPEDFSKSGGLEIKDSKIARVIREKPKTALTLEIENGVAFGEVRYCETVSAGHYRCGVDIITSVFFFLFVGVFVYTSWTFYWSSQTMQAGAEILGIPVPGERSFTDWGPPYYPVKFIMPFGGLLLTLQGVVWLIRDVYFVATGRTLT